MKLGTLVGFTICLNGKWKRLDLIKTPKPLAIVLDTVG